MESFSFIILCYFEDRTTSVSQSGTVRKKWETGSTRLTDSTTMTKHTKGNNVSMSGSMLTFSVK